MLATRLLDEYMLDEYTSRPVLAAQRPSQMTKTVMAPITIERFIVMPFPVPSLPFPANSLLAEGGLTKVTILGSDHDYDTLSTSTASRPLDLRVQNDQEALSG